METRHIHYKNDFILRERFRDASGSLVPLPDEVDFEMVYQTKHGDYIASRVGGVYSNCVPDGDALLVIFKDHGLCQGTLVRELHLKLINDLMPDGFQNVYYPEAIDVELWHLASDTTGVIECDALAAYTRGLPFTFDDFTPEQLASLKGDKGDPFTWADFTPAQIELLQRPATVAAGKADTAAENAQKATANLTKAAQQLEQTSGAAVSSCNAATSAANKAKAAADTAATNARQAATAANTERELLEQSRQRLEQVADRAEAAAHPVPSGLRVSDPAPLTLGNSVPRYIEATVLPTSALQNIIYQAAPGASAMVEPDGRIVPMGAGVTRVHVIPTNGTRFFKTVAVTVVVPSLRLSGSALRLDAAGNLRLT